MFENGERYEDCLWEATVLLDISSDNFTHPRAAGDGQVLGPDSTVLSSKHTLSDQRSAGSIHILQYSHSPPKLKKGCVHLRSPTEHVVGRTAWSKVIHFQWEMRETLEVTHHHPTRNTRRLPIPVS